MKKFKGLLLSSMTVFVLAACGGGTTTEEPETTTPEDTTEETTDEADTTAPEDTTDQAAEDTDDTTVMEGQVYTLEDLSEYDGQDGNPAYVAVDGVVYDVTDNEAWENGEHAGQQLAGTDATEVILESPHGESVLEDLEVVGTLEQ